MHPLDNIIEETIKEFDKEFTQNTEDGVIRPLYFDNVVAFLSTALRRCGDRVAKDFVKSLGEPTGENGYIINPYKGEWWLEHKVVGSGEPLLQGILNPYTMKNEKQGKCCKKCYSIWTEKDWPAHTTYDACIDPTCKCHTKEEVGSTGSKERLIVTIPQGEYKGSTGKKGNREEGCPMGVSEWKAYGKRYGYWGYFVNQFKDEKHGGRINYENGYRDALNAAEKGLPKKRDFPQVGDDFGWNFCRSEVLELIKSLR